MKQNLNIEAEGNELINFTEIPISIKNISLIKLNKTYKHINRDEI